MLSHMLFRPSKRARFRTTYGIRTQRLKRKQASAQRDLFQRRLCSTVTTICTGLGLFQKPDAPPDAVPCYTVEAPQEFDPKGKELVPDAQVWKTYVKEADQVDEELVDGWNKSTDVILIFAALFSAISTAFVIESYKNLKQDPADVTSQTLLAISQTLAFIANGSQPTNAPRSAEDTPFKASKKAICVNVLWFLSLSISVAVSLISMLAKEWCLEFMAGRTGPPGAQARRRQQRWDGLVGWKMKEVIGILPSLIHVSLLLFAIGLCVFLWDVHFGVAIPVVIVTTLATGAYFACTVLPFVYDFCPYGTVLSRSLKQLMGAKTQPARDVKQDEVTANALHWMITTCETPRSVDVALQSLAGAEEGLAPDMLDKCNAWLLIQQHLASGAPWTQPLHPSREREVYQRASNTHLIVRRQVDQMDYGENDETRRLEQLVLGVQSTINSLVHEVMQNQRWLDRGTIKLLKRCTHIGRHYLAEGKIVDETGWYRYAVPVEPEGLVEDLVTLFERYLRREIDMEVGTYHALSASLAFVLCCNTSRGLTELSTNAGYALQLIRALSGLNRFERWKDHLLHLTSWTLWILISADYSAPKPTTPTLHASTNTALKTLWSIISRSVYSDTSALMRFDATYLRHGLLYLLSNAAHHDLRPGDFEIIDEALYDMSDDSYKIQPSFHSRYIQDLTRSLTGVTDVGPLMPQVFGCLGRLKKCSPWQDAYLFPTPEIYVFVIKACFTRHAHVAAPMKYDQLRLFPFPQCSPRLIRLLAENDIVPTCLTALSDENKITTRAFATAQLWLLFNMSLRASDRTAHELSTLEGMLLQCPQLENNLDKQAEVADELETALIEIFRRGYLKGPSPSLGIYLCRVIEVMLHQRNAPLPEMACSYLEDVPKRLRGPSAFVNLETDGSTVYPDVGPYLKEEEN